MVFQLHGEHDRRHTAPHTVAARPPYGGEVLRFSDGVAGVHAWAARAGASPFAVQLLQKDFAPVQADTGCMLDPISMSRHGGALTLRAQDSKGGWTADWSGERTMPTLEEVGAGELPSSDRGRFDIAVLAAEDCGSQAEVRISRSVLRDLMDVLAGHPLTPPDPADKGQVFNIRADNPT